jgi:hypothetical protein
VTKRSADNGGLPLLVPAINYDCAPLVRVGLASRYGGKWPKEVPLD